MGRPWPLPDAPRQGGAGRARDETDSLLQPPPVRSSPRLAWHGGHKLEDSLDLAGSVSGVPAAESLRTAAESCGRAGGPACTEPVDAG